MYNVHVMWLIWYVNHKRMLIVRATRTQLLCVYEISLCKYNVSTKMCISVLRYVPLHEIGYLDSDFWLLVLA